METIMAGVKNDIKGELETNTQLEIKNEIKGIMQGKNRRGGVSGLPGAAEWMKQQLKKYAEEKLLVEPIEIKKKVTKKECFIEEDELADLQIETKKSNDTSYDMKLGVEYFYTSLSKEQREEWRRITVNII